MASLVQSKEIRVRIAPSPTGRLHIGNARAALFNFLFARHAGGTFILRIEDTDLERSRKEYEIELIEGLHWLGIDWDEGADLTKDGTLISKGDYGPYRDSERVALHVKYIQKFLDDGKAYRCYCTKEELDAQRAESEGRHVPFRYPGTCRDLTSPPPGKSPQVVRLKMPSEAIVFHDLIRGRVSIRASEFDDFAIARADGSPLYNFAVAINDYEMKISHVIRGEEHISNTPKQIAVYRALGAEPPTFAHTPLILNPDRSKMSKRFGDTALADYRAKGYLPNALVNFLALLGWHPKDDREVLSLDELVAEFDISRVQKAGAVFDQNKLDWLNREYLKKMTDEEIATLLLPSLEEGDLELDHATLLKIIAIGRGRANTLRDLIESAGIFFALPDYDAGLLIWQKIPVSMPNVATVLQNLLETLTKTSDRFAREEIIGAVNTVIGDRRKGEIFWPLRVAVSGETASPDPVDIMEVLGKKESLRRINVALQKTTS